MPAICTISSGNPGQRCDKGDNRGVPVGIILAESDQVFSTYANAVDESVWETAVKNKQLFFIPNVLEFTDNSEETVIYRSPLGKAKFSRLGKYIVDYMIDASSYTNTELQKFNGRQMRAFIVDSNNLVWGYSDDATTVQGQTVTVITGKQSIPGPDGTPGWTHLQLTMNNPNEWNKFGILLEPDWVVEDLATIANVDLAVVGTPTSSELIISVNQANNVIQDGGAKPSIPITGLVEADFTVVDGSGTTQLPADTFTDNSDGTYTFAWTAALVTGTANLKAVASQTGDQYVESTGAVSFTI